MNELDNLKIKKKGFITKYPAFKKDEFEFIRQSIEDQYKNVLLKENIPRKLLDNHFKNIFNVNIYHEISKFVDHSKIWNKLNRVLPKDFADWFSESSYISKLRKYFGDIEITDEEGLGYSNIYWRLVRPNIDRDVGSLHRDAWFWEIDILQGKNIPQYTRLKSWISIFVEPNKNGLLVVPESHKKDKLQWKIVEKDGRKKPFFESRIEERNICLLDTKNNSVVIFDDNLLHGGAKNNGNFTRVSLEFTLFLKNKN